MEASRFCAEENAGQVRYVLRIAYSIIHELHPRDFEATTRPVDESQVNGTMEAVGRLLRRLRL